MANELNTLSNTTVAEPSALNVGAIAIEQERAIAEAQGKLTLAKRFPRSVAAAMAEFMEVCKFREFADAAFYTIKNRGSGPSIRFAEEIARVYGNFQYGHRELSRSDDRSEIEVYAWDMEKNNHSTRQITVLHVVDYKDNDGNKRQRKLTDQADIDNRIANIASKQMRGRILALVPKHMVSAGIAACKLTLSGGNDKPMVQRVLEMTEAFGKRGITADMLAKYIGHPLDNLTPDDLADLVGVWNAIKDGAKPSDYFGTAEPEGPDVQADGFATRIASATTIAEIEAMRKEFTRLPAGERKAALDLAAARVEFMKGPKTAEQPASGEDSPL